MKSLRKSILTLLALTLFGGAGAWAQGPTQVIEITIDMLPASWETDVNPVTLADLQALGLVAVDESVAQAWTGAPQGDFAVLFFGFDEGNLNYIAYDGGNPSTPSQSDFNKGDFYSQVLNYMCFFTTGSPAIELTKEGANQWTLGQAPDYDLELQVEYYEAHALKNIPAGWTVLVNGDDKTNLIEGDSLMIVETDSVTLVPAGNPRRVKSVTLEDEAPAVQTVNIGGINLQIAEGDTWAQIIARNPGVIWDEAGLIDNGSGLLIMGGNFVETSHPYDPARQSDYHWVTM